MPVQTVIVCQEPAEKRATNIPRRGCGWLTDCERDDAAKPMLTISDGKREYERKGPFLDLDQRDPHQYTL